MSLQATPFAIGQRLADSFTSGNLQPIWSGATLDMQKALGSVDAFASTREDVLAKFGKESEVLSERLDPHDDLQVFTRVSRWTNTTTPLELIIAFNEAKLVAGFWIRPQLVAVSSPHVDYETKAQLRLPFNGEWYVYWGGRTLEENYHAVNAAQCFALDLLVLRDGKSHTGNGTSLQTYHCWEQPILAPADGVVALAIDGLPDHPIGESDPVNPAGNHVVIDFGNNEHGFLLHLCQGSVRVAVGDRVTAGQEIGLCGNSGNSSEPHLHFHLQTSPDMLNGEGLPAQFLNYKANGTSIDRGEPKRGEVICIAE